MKGKPEVSNRIIAQLFSHASHKNHGLTMGSLHPGVYTGADLGLGLSGPGPEQINYIMKFIIKTNEIHISERPW